MIFDSISKGTCSQILRPMFQAITRPYSISSALTLMRSHVEANRHRPQRSMPCFLPVVNGQDIEHDVQVGREARIG